MVQPLQPHKSSAGCAGGVPEGQQVDVLGLRGWHGAHLGPARARVPARVPVPRGRQHRHAAPQPGRAHLRCAAPLLLPTSLFTSGCMANLGQATSRARLACVGSHCRPYHTTHCFIQLPACGAEKAGGQHGNARLCRLSASAATAMHVMLLRPEWGRMCRRPAW